MNLAELSKSDAVYARVMLRQRQKAWDHFFWLQDLKVGQTILLDRKEIVYVTAVLDKEYGYDVVIEVQRGEDNFSAKFLFGMQINYAEKGCHDLYVRYLNRPVTERANKGEADVRDAYRFLSPASEMTSVLYSKDK